MNEKSIDLVVGSCIVILFVIMLISDPFGLSKEIEESLPDYESAMPYEMELIDKNIGTRGIQGFTVYNFVFTNGTSSVRYTESYEGTHTYATMRVGENYTVNIDKYGHALTVDL